MNVLNQWLEELYQELQGISEDDRKDILESYEEQINEMIDLKINEREILSKLGSPKKVAQEIKQSFTDTETVSAQNKQIVFNIREKTNDDVIKKAIYCCLHYLIVCLTILFNYCSSLNYWRFFTIPVIGRTYDCDIRIRFIVFKYWNCLNLYWLVGI